MERSDGVTVSSAERGDGGALGRLFDDYRVFYRWNSDPSGSKRFIEERIEDGATRIFVARMDSGAVGFAQVMPVFHTTALRPSWILEDLFVDPASRNRGAGSALLRHVEAFARAGNADRLTLTTAHTNEGAQKLYETNGYRLDDVFRTYHLALRPERV